MPPNVAFNTYHPTARTVAQSFQRMQFPVPPHSSSVEHSVTHLEPLIKVKPATAIERHVFDAYFDQLVQTGTLRDVLGYDDDSESASAPPLTGESAWTKFQNAIQTSVLSKPEARPQAHPQHCQWPQPYAGRPFVQHPHSYQRPSQVTVYQAAPHSRCFYFNQ